MGLFKIKGSSRADATRAVFQPFSGSRRLSNIAEEEGGSEIDILEGSDSRESSSKRSASKGTPNRNKNTPNRRKHRFQRLVEWDYGEPNEAEQPQYYEPPQDFLHVQREYGDHFFENGPERSTMVQVDNKMTLEDARKANEKARTKKDKNAGSGTLKIFQFAADTASLSKSCSSDSSVCSTSVASKGPFGAAFEDNKVGGSMKTSSLTASSSSQSKADSNEYFPVTNTIARVDNKTGTRIPKLSAPRASGRSLFTTKDASPLVKTKKTVAQHFTRESESEKEPSESKEPKDWRGNAMFDSTVDFEDSEGFAAFPAFPQTMQADNPDGFDGIDWPSDYITHTKGGSTNSSKQEWRTNNVDFHNAEPKPTDQNRMKRKVNNEVDDESSTGVEARRLVERTEAFINNTKSLLRESGADVESKVRRNIRSPYEDSRSEMDKSEQELSQDVEEEVESPSKENENSGPSFSNSNSIFRSKKVQFEKKVASPPLTKIPSNDAETHGRAVKFGNNRVPKYGNSRQRKVPEKQPTREYFTPQRHAESRSNVSFRFESDNEGPRGYYSEPRRRVKQSNNIDSLRQDKSKHHLPLKRALETSTATLGATPMESPDSMHLAVDIDKKGSFASTIDSSDSQSTATSVSTFVEHSPRGIRGSFPTQTVQTSSSLSTGMSSVSTNILNDADFFKPSAPAAGARRRPPTGVPPTSIFGSMLFQAGEQQDIPVTASVSRSISPKRETARGVPHDIHATDDTTISDVTGSTAASEWMIQGNKLLSRYYYNNNDGAHNGASQKKQKLSRRFRQQEGRSNVAENQNIIEAVGGRRSQQQPQKRRFTGYVSEFNERNDPLDKMKRYQNQFQYPTITTNTSAGSGSRSVRSGFDNLDDNDANSLFEA